MKKKLIPIVIGLSAATLLSGCVFAIGLGSGDKKNSTTNNDSHPTTNTSSNPAVVQTVAPTVGQQLLDLKKAHDAGAISDSEYQTEKAKLLSEK
jgi:hypothetical protein